MPPISAHAAHDTFDAPQGYSSALRTRARIPPPLKRAEDTFLASKQPGAAWRRGLKPPSDKTLKSRVPRGGHDLFSPSASDTPILPLRMPDTPLARRHTLRSHQSTTEPLARPVQLRPTSLKMLEIPPHSRIARPRAPLEPIAECDETESECDSPCRWHAALLIPMDDVQTPFENPMLVPWPNCVDLRAESFSPETPLPAKRRGRRSMSTPSTELNGLSLSCLEMETDCTELPLLECVAPSRLRSAASVSASPSAKKGTRKRKSDDDTATNEAGMSSRPAKRARPGSTSFIDSFIAHAISPPSRKRRRVDLDGDTEQLANSKKMRVEMYYID
ncbi:hypothetical protein MKEN_00169700 [Mycena kentingensis (nom. inval.)]|nr:hypothetical protein MKEN_00169700 [Mycena kentingensis (nom. inval.)]